MNENYEVEMMETDCTDIEEFETDGGNSKSGLIPKLIVGGVIAAVVGGIAVGKKLKSKKDAEPKKKKKFHVGWIEVDDEAVAEVEAEVVEEK